MFDIDMEDATSLSVTLLIIGIGMSVYPLLIIRTKDWGSDRRHLAVIGVFILILVIASQAVYLTKKNPDILIPLVVVTLGFRILSPGILVTSFQQRLTNEKWWKYLRGLMMLAALGLIFYTFISGMTERTNQNIAISERGLMTMAVAFTFSRAYLKVFRQFLFNWEEKYILFSGLLLGIAFVILIPFIWDDFDRVYKLTGTVGWLGAFVSLYRSPTLKISKKDGVGEGTSGTTNSEDEKDANKRS